MRASRRGKRRGSLAALLLSTTALVGIAASHALGADTTWTGATDTDWSVNTNWDTANVPTNADNVFINTTTGFPVIGAGTSAAGTIVTIGDTAAGALQILDTGAELNATNLILGDGAQGNFSVANTGTLNLTNSFVVGQGANGFATITSSSAVTVGGNGLVAFGDGTTGQLTFSNGATGTFSNILAVGIGTGSNGTLTIQSDADVDTADLHLGSNAGAQGTALVTGTGSTLDISAFLTIGDGGTGSLTIADNAVVTATLNNNVNVGNAASGNGTVTISDGGSLTLGGPLVVGNLGTGTLTVSSAGTVDANSFQIGGGAGGIGTATVTGAGSTLTAATGSYVGNSGTGTLSITDGGVVDVQAGFLRIGYQIGGNGTVSVDGSGSALNVTGQLQVGFDGSGTLTIADGGTVGVNGGAGTLTIGSQAGSNGIVNIGAAAADPAAVAGTLVANTVAFGVGGGLLVFNHTDTNYDFHANITGSTGTIFHRAGVTLLSGTSNSFAGTTVITGGSLYVNNSLGGTVNVNSGTIGGSGTLTGALNMNGSGTIAPGNSIGTLNVADITMNSGSTYMVELNDGGFVAGTNNDLINATGTATINGGTVHVTPVNGTDTGTTYTLGTYTILTAAGGVTGTFDTLTDNYAFLNFALAYDANNVFLTSSLAAATFCLSGMSANQCAAGEGVFSLGSGSLYTAVLNLSNAEAPGALDQLSGEIHASAKTALIEDSRFVREAAVARTRAAFDAVASDRTAVAEQHISDRLAFWGQGFGSWGSWEGDGNAASLDRSIGGLFLGGDARVDSNVRIGVLGGYSRSDFDVDARASSGEADSYHLGLYGGGQWGALGLRLGGAYAWHDIETARAVAFTGFSDQLTASYDAATAQVFGETGYRIVAGETRFEPFANLAYLNLDSDDITESGGEAALTVASGATDTTFMTLGVRADTALMLGGAETRLRGTLGWRHVFGDDVPVSLMTFASGSDAFTIASVPIAEDVLVVDAGVDIMLAPAAVLGLAYGAQFGSGVSDQGLKGRLDVKF